MEVQEHVFNVGEEVILNPQMLAEDFFGYEVAEEYLAITSKVINSRAVGIIEEKSGNSEDGYWYRVHFKDYPAEFKTPGSTFSGYDLRREYEYRLVDTLAESVLWSLLMQAAKQSPVLSKDSEYLAQVEDGELIIRRRVE